jgi:hypothetical protein
MIKKIVIICFLIISFNGYSQKLEFEDEIIKLKVELLKKQNEIDISTTLFNKSKNSIFFAKNLSHAYWFSDNLLIISVGWDHQDELEYSEIEIVELKSNDSSKINTKLVNRNNDSLISIRVNYLKYNDYKKFKKSNKNKFVEFYRRMKWIEVNLD